MEELLGRGAPVLHRNLHCLTISVFRPDVEIVLNDDSTIGQMAPGYAPELEDQKKQARELVERIAKELRSAGFKVVARFADAALENGCHIQAFPNGSQIDMFPLERECGSPRRQREDLRSGQVR